MFLDVHIIDEQDVLVGSSLPDLPVVCPGIEPRPPSIEPFLSRHNASVGFLTRRLFALERVVPLPVIQVPAAPELDVFEPPLNPFAFSLEEFDGCLRILLFSSDFVDHPDVAVALLVQKVQILSGEGEAVAIMQPVYYPFMKAIENNGEQSNLEFEEGHTYYTSITGYDGLFKRMTIYKFTWTPNCEFYFHDTDSTNLAILYEDKLGEE